MILGRRRYVSGGGYLLDTYANGAAAYSLRKLKTGATYAVKVRRDSDNATCDVLLETSGSITLSSSIANLSGGSGSTLGAWITTDSGYVDTWYDQSGNGNNVTQATTTLQFRIVNTGTLDTKNGNAGLYAISSLKSLLLGSGLSAIAYGNSFTSYTVSSSDNTNKLGTIWLNNDTTITSNAGVLHDTRTQKRLAVIANSSTYVNMSIQRATTNQFLLEYISDGTNFYGYDNGAAASSTTATSYTNTGFNIGGGYASVSNYLDGYIQEVIIFSEEKTTDRTAIESNINSYYTIY